MQRINNFSLCKMQIIKNTYLLFQIICQFSQYNDHTEPLFKWRNNVTTKI